MDTELLLNELDEKNVKDFWSRLRSLTGSSVNRGKHQYIKGGEDEIQKIIEYYTGIGYKLKFDKDWYAVLKSKDQTIYIGVPENNKIEIKID